MIRSTMMATMSKSTPQVINNEAKVYVWLQ